MRHCLSLTFPLPRSTELPFLSFYCLQVRALSDRLHAQGFKFGIYGAAGFTTCGKRAGSLYHERQDALWYKEQGVDYLKCACHVPCRQGIRSMSTRHETCMQCAAGC